jgi:heme/copper-type cytochrome/quinol oxidase subunit 2
MSEMGGGVIEMALFYTLLMVGVAILFFIFAQLFRKKEEDKDCLKQLSARQ